jgi:hypothetical protein
MPGIFATLIVAAGLFGFGLLVLIRSGLLVADLPLWLSRYWLWIIAAIFLLRAIGDFNYVGFFKKYRQTIFGRNDTRYYSPLCLLIAMFSMAFPR